MFVVKDMGKFSLLINERQILGFLTKHQGNNSTLPNAWLKNMAKALPQPDPD